MAKARIFEMNEGDVWALAERELDAGGDWPVLLKREWAPTQGGVCLKRTRDGFILAASCDRDDAIRFFMAEDGQVLHELAERFVAEMETSGNPLSLAVTIPVPRKPDR